MFVIYGLLILSTLVFVHELGHFLAAKLCKIPVEAFSIGFGKPLLKKKIGETEYRLSPIPFGGYVKMVGDEGTLGNDGFNQHPIWQRALVAVAGPLFNFIFAYILLLVIFQGERKIPEYYENTTIGAIQPNSATYGIFQVKDSLVSINGKKVHDWHDIDRAFTRLDDSYHVTFYRNGILDSLTFSIPLPTKGSDLIKESGVTYLHTPIVSDVSDSSPAKAAGIEKGDVIISLNNDPISSFTAVGYYVQKAHKDSAAVRVGIQRGDSTFITEMQPQMVVARVKKKLFSKPDTTWRPIIGVSVKEAPVRYEEASFANTLKRTNKSFKEHAEDVFLILNPVKLVKLLRFASGPIGIIQMSGKYAETGSIIVIFYILSVLSINLGILNLLPLVITDGGILFFLLIEAVRKKPVSQAKQELLTKIFFILFLSLFLFVTFNDIKNYKRNDKLIEGR